MIWNVRLYLEMIPEIDDNNTQMTENTDPIVKEIHCVVEWLAIHSTDYW